jgi:hypothetical protein
MALRLLQNHLRYVEQRVSASGHLDLARQGFHPFFIRDNARIDFGQRRRWFAAYTRFTSLEIRSWTTVPDTLAFRPRATTFSPLAVTFASTFRAGRAWASAISSAVRPFLVGAFVVGVFGPSGLLGPGREEQFFQIKLAIR